MNEDQISTILDELRALPGETEWLEFKQARNSYDFDKLGRYFSAISNEANLKGRDYGWLIFGVDDKTHAIVGSQYRLDPTKLESLKREVANHCSGALSFLDIFCLQRSEGRVVMFQITAAPRGMPTAWKRHYFGRDNESICGLNIQELETIRAQVALEDWSAHKVVEADLDDLDPDAMNIARDKYREKHPELSDEIDQWDDWRFLHKLKVASGQRLTRAALLLLGRHESSRFLPNTYLQLSWILQDTDGIPLDYRHIGLPFLTGTERVFAQIRNLTYRYMGDDSLFPTELPQYDTWVIREALHNCIAHQDYALGGKVNIVEKPEELVFSNLAEFIPQTVEAVIQQDVPPERYRNPTLAAAMVELKMIDTIGSGIKRMFITQRKRLFPLPDYSIDIRQRRVEVRLFGRVLDEKYTRVLKALPDLSLPDVMLLDAVQKGRPLSDEGAKVLRRKKLIEGRKPNLHVSERVADVTGERVAYTRNRGLDKDFYKQLLLKHLDRFGSATREEIDQLLRGKLADLLSEDQKINKIRNLITEMRAKDGTITNRGTKRKPRWERV
jgi:ATP-dependent DNA helicase RecG